MPQETGAAAGKTDAGSNGGGAAAAAQGGDFLEKYRISDNGIEGDPPLDPPIGDEPAAGQGKEGGEAKAGEGAGEAGAGEGSGNPDGEGGEGAEGSTGKEGEGVESGKAAQARVYAGKFKTPEELEKAYSESSHEGVRLYRELRATQDDLRTRDEKIAELEADLAEAKKTPAFRELGEEELKALLEQNPVKAYEYIADKKLRERDAAESKRRQKEQGEQAKRERMETTAKIEKRLDYMDANPGEFPEYATLKPVIGKIMEDFPELTGHDWSPDVLYTLAYGLKARSARSQVAGKSAQATEEAKKKALAAAKAGSPGGEGGGDGRGKKVDPNSDEALNDRLIAAGRRKSVFA